MKRLLFSVGALLVPALALDACSDAASNAVAIDDSDAAASGGNTDAAASSTDSAAPVVVPDADLGPTSLFAFVGSGDGKIRTYSVDESTGAWTALQEVASGQNPWFLAFDPPRRRVLAVDDKSGLVSSYNFDSKTGALTLVNARPTGGASPVHVSIDPTGKWAMVANYGGGNFSVRGIEADGTLTDTTATMPSGGGSHWAGMDIRGVDIFVASVERNVVAQYRLDPKNGGLLSNGWCNPPAGLGVRHLVMHPSKKWVYSVNSAANITAYFFDRDFAGKIWPFETVSALPSGQDPNGVSGAEIVAHPNGKWLFASTRGFNTIATFEVDQATGKPTLVGNTPTNASRPRSFAMDVDGKFIYAGNEEANHVVGFRIDAATGALTPIGTKTVDVATPSFVGLARFPK